MSLRAWIQASRPLAQANLAGPVLLGQALAFERTGRFGWPWLAALFGWTILDQLVIVWGNDYADRAHDMGGSSKTPFSGGSGVLPEGKLRPRSLRRAAIGAYALLLALGVALAVLRTVWALPLTLAAGLLLWAYSYPPLRLSYRGHGEHLQALGIGVVLPLLGFAVQAGGLGAFPWEALIPTYLFGFAGNVATALPDVGLDRKAQKRTWPVRYGVSRSRWLCLAITVAALGGVSAFGHPLAAALGTLPLIGAFRLGRGREAIVRFIVLQGAATQIGLLGWAAFLLWL
jgi:1,4-dihydroxy-2-naphthoate octaprenyltransferase